MSYLSTPSPFIYNRALNWTLMHSGTFIRTPVGLTRVGFFETRWSPEAVILSAAKDLSPGQAQILRCAQDDTSHLDGSFPQKPTRVSTLPVPQTGRSESYCSDTSHYTLLPVAVRKSVVAVSLAV